MPSTEVPTDGYRQIRVPAKVVKVWHDEHGTFCALDNGALYTAVLTNTGRKWALDTPPLTEEQR